MRQLVLKLNITPERNGHNAQNCTGVNHTIGINKTHIRSYKSFS